ncbi:MAG: hypothetical protein HKN87_21295 [Saprospiraceae bacterium]|nr:hypothetical protein [Saprospiraceae bacterium]
MQSREGAIHIPYGLLAVLLLMTSCVNHRELITLNAGEENLESGKNQAIRKTDRVSPTEYVIHPKDLLIIHINTFEGNTSEFLQRAFSSNDLNNNGGRQFGPEALYYNSYQVDGQGFIYLPLIERINVSGKTPVGVKTALDSAYAKHFRFVSANVKLANMRVTVLGEVENPGLVYFYNDETTLLEAISMAGDFSDFGNRKKVKLIRRTESGSTTAMLDLYNSDFIGTEYFYVKPNDIIYVEPIKAKAFDVGAESVGIVLSVVSTLALLANIFIDLKRE